MWPGQQAPGGEQNPQDPHQNPYQQPGYPQHNPYQQPGYQQPNPYATQPGAQQPGPAQWTAPATPGGPQPGGGGGNKRTTIIAITAAIAVVAAAVITGVMVLGGDGDDKEPTAKGGAQPSASAPASPSATAEAPEDNPRAGGEIKPVIDGWKTVISSKRHNAFDVPSDWEVESPTMSHGFEDDKGKGLVAMSATASYKKGECEKNDKRGSAGTKGAQGAKSEASAAEIEALNWVYAAFDQKQTGKFNQTKAQPFKSDHGITGYTASATVTGVKKTGKCVTDGKAFTVTYKDTNGDLATWVLYAATGFDGELPDETIKKIMSSLRPLKSS
ncbi:proline-rich domain-containing protein [Streptomyces sp. NPDC021096]|uniref:proline-rich domain-containing protein n=1 Tax=Streptomyces sp. NPDC021096 TaxID=3154792 RepID=UPI0033FA0A09